MTFGFKECGTQIKLSSKAVEKFIKIQKNLTKPVPKLWSDAYDVSTGELDRNGVRSRLTLSHPILRILDSCYPSLHQFNQIHCQIVVLGLFQHSLAAGRFIKKLCSSRFTLSQAVNFFEHLENPDAFCCNTIIRGYVNFDDPGKALAFYHTKMVYNGIFQNNYTFPILVKACADLGLITEGQKIHTHIIRCGFELDLYVRNALIHMYSVYGNLQDARKVFDLSPDSDLVTWNTMIDGYVKNREVSNGRLMFDSMKEKDAVSWNSMISGYIGIGDMEAAKELFEKNPYRDIISWNCMIDGYAKAGDKNAARMLFDQMDSWNIVSLNAMLALYVRLKDYNECLRLFGMIVEEGSIELNNATLVSALTSCAYLGRLDKGQWIYSYIKSSLRAEPDVLLLTALLTMFAKCGDMNKAKDVFDDIPEKNIVSWNSMIMGYGMQGTGEKALEMFLQMEKNGQTPNDATFTCILSACTHAGMVLEGWWYFDLMHKVYNIEPKVEHCGCMVDLLSKAGLTKDSEKLVRNVPLELKSALHGVLLSAFKTCSIVELGEIVAKRLIEIEPTDIGPYVLLSNIYATDGRWEDLEHVRMIMKEKEAQKMVGFIQIQVSDAKGYLCHGSRLYHKKSMVYSMLGEIGTHLKLCCRE